MKVSVLVVFLSLSAVLTACTAPIIPSAPSPTPTPNAQAIWAGIQKNVPALRDVTSDEAKDLMLLVGSDVDYLTLMAQIAGTRGADSLKFQTILKVSDDDIRMRPGFVLRRIIEFVRGYANQQPAGAQRRAVAYEILRRTFFSLDVATMDRIVELSTNSSQQAYPPSQPTSIVPFTYPTAAPQLNYVARVPDTPIPEQLHVSATALPSPTPTPALAQIIGGIPHVGLGETREYFIGEYGQSIENPATKDSFVTNLKLVRYEASFTNDRAKKLMLSFDRVPDNGVIIEQAKEVAQSLIPRDAVSVESYDSNDGKGTIGSVYTYTSRALTLLFERNLFTDYTGAIKPGIFHVIYNQLTKGKVSTITIETGGPTKLVIQGRIP